MRTVFMGSGPLSCGSLDVLRRHSEVVGVVTPPDRPRGRRLRRQPCDVNALAREAGLTVLTPPSVNAPEVAAELALLDPDVIVVVAYGQLLRRALLELPPLGCVNMHTSLLPEYRGAAPIPWAIAEGQTRTGVTTIYMDAGMDTGDVILQRAVAIRPDDTAGSLQERLAVEGARLLGETVDAIADGTAPRRPQDHTKATTTRRLTKADGRLDWSATAEALVNRVRGFDPWPGAFTTCPGGTLLKIRRAQAEPDPEPAAELPLPGAVIRTADGGLLVQCGRGRLRALEVQPEGGKVMRAAAYLCGRRLEDGARLE